MLLRKDDPWFKEMPIPDIRNWRVVDPDGNLVGFVESLAVNRESGQLEAVLTGPNERYPVDALEIGDHFVVVRSEAWWRVRSPESSSGRERESRQILNTESDSGQNEIQAGISMANGKPEGAR